MIFHVGWEIAKKNDLEGGSNPNIIFSKFVFNTEFIAKELMKPRLLF